LLTDIHLKTSVNMTSQKTALVTGASSGLGAHFGRVLAAQGYHVLLAARRLDKVADLAGEIAMDGGSAEPLKMDVTNAASVDTAFETMICPPDVEINNAGGAGTVRPWT
jgi:NADP-dependent 3-hydroxy acid dehydrogenase YdfG